MEKSREDRIMNISTMKEMKAVKHFDSDLSERWRWGTNFSKILRWGTARGTANSLFVWLITTCRLVSFSACSLFAEDHYQLKPLKPETSPTSPKLDQPATCMDAAGNLHAVSAVPQTLAITWIIVDTKNYRRIMTNVTESDRLLMPFFQTSSELNFSKCLIKPYQAVKTSIPKMQCRFTCEAAMCNLCNLCSLPQAEVCGWSEETCERWRFWASPVGQLLGSWSEGAEGAGNETASGRFWHV